MQQRGPGWWTEAQSDEGTHEQVLGGGDEEEEEHHRYSGGKAHDGQAVLDLCRPPQSLSTTPASINQLSHRSSAYIGVVISGQVSDVLGNAVQRCDVQHGYRDIEQQCMMQRPIVEHHHLTMTVN